MKFISRLTVASATFFIAYSAQAQQSGTGPSGSIPFGKGAGVQGYTWRAPAAARAAAGLNIEAYTGHGDSIYSIAATDRVVGTNASLTASRAWTLPAASAVNPGQCILVSDFQATVTGTNTIVITRAGSDTINGAGTTATINVAGGGYLVCADGVSKWSAQAVGAQAYIGSPSRTAVSGATAALSSTNCGQYVERSASGSVMTDTLSTSGLSANCVITIKNNDASAPYEVTVSGGTLDGVSSGFMMLGYLQSGSIQFDGTNFHTIGKPTRVLTSPAGYTFYVAASGGSDSNHGLDASHPWATRQKCWNFYQGSVDMGGTAFGTSNICKLATGTYTDQFQASGTLIGQDFAAKLTFKGDTTTPSNVLINYAGLAWSADDKAMFAIQGVRNTTSLNGSNLILAQHGGSLIVILDHIEMLGGAAVNSHFVAQLQGQIVFTAGYKIVASGGGAGCSWLATAQGQILVLNALVVDQSGGSITFTTGWACSTDLGYVSATGLTYNGGSTGPRYYAINNAIINTAGGGASYFSGNSGGAATVGAVYE